MRRVGEGGVVTRPEEAPVAMIVLVRGFISPALVVVVR